MKYVIKAEDITNLPATRPLLAADNNGNCGCRPAPVPVPVPVPSAVGDYLYSDITCSSSYDSSKTPIAICVGLPSSFADGKARYMSLVNMSATDPEHGTTTIGNDLANNPGAGLCWGYNQLTIPGITDYDNSTEVLNDKDGKANTAAIMSVSSKYSTGAITKDDYSEGSYPAATACYRFFTAGTAAHDWYLPAMGELKPVYDNLTTINSKLEALGNLAIKVGDSSTKNSLGWRL